MKNIIIVSNRLPVSVKERDGKWVLEKIVSGLVSGLEDFKERFDNLKWIGWEGIKDLPYESNLDINRQIKENGFINVELSKNIIQKGYEGFCKKELWGIFHNCFNNSRFINEEWNAFVEMNQAFADTIIKEYKKDDIIYIQDFQLMLVPQMLKTFDKNIKVGFFLHIPFPSSDIFKLIPTYKRFIVSLSEADYVGFHTENFAKNYKELCLEEDCSIDNIDINPIGINREKLVVDHLEVKKIRESIGTKIILGCERADYPKGIIERLESYKFLLKNYSDIREKVTLIQIAVGANLSTDPYDQIGREIHTLVSEINGRYSTMDWTPIKYITRGLNKSDLFNLYSASDICSINSLADGLNLTSFEYVLVPSQIKRDLILSKFTGAGTILKDALIVNPRDINQVGNLFYNTLIESKNNVSELKDTASNCTIEKWVDQFLDKVTI